MLERCPALRGVVLAGAEYASYVELGTSRFILQPNGYRFLTNAVADRAEQINQIFVDAVNEAIARAKGMTEIARATGPGRLAWRRSRQSGRQA